MSETKNTPADVAGMTNEAAAALVDLARDELIQQAKEEGWEPLSGAANGGALLCAAFRLAAAALRALPAPEAEDA